MKNIGSFEFSVPWFVLIVIFSPIIEKANCLECIYCPEYSTEHECRDMNLTQICINETKCGYARFIQKQKDLGQLYPEDLKKEYFTVTIKKGCMDEDYCAKIQEKNDSSLSSSECIFCDEALCELKFPILCVQCDEAKDQYCAIQTEPIIQCQDGEVCFRKLDKENNSTQKRGCMQSSHCLKKDFCEYCESDICWTNPLPSYSSKLGQMIEEESNKTSRNRYTGRSSKNRSISNYSKWYFFLITIMVFNLSYSHFQFV